MLISDVVLSIVATVLLAIALFTHEDDIEEWAEEQRKHYR